MADPSLAHSELRHLSDDEWEVLRFHLVGFREATTWAGTSKGWVFKTDWAGLGYYRDTQETAGTVLLHLSATCQSLRARTRSYLKPFARHKLLAASRSWISPHASLALGRYLAETGSHDHCPRTVTCCCLCFPRLFCSADHSVARIHCAQPLE